MLLTSTTVGYSRYISSSLLYFFSWFRCGRYHVAPGERYIFQVGLELTNRNGPRSSQPPPFWCWLTNTSQQQLFARGNKLHRLRLSVSCIDVRFSRQAAPSILPPFACCLQFGVLLSLSRQSIANSSPTQTLRDLFRPCLLPPPPSPEIHPSQAVVPNHSPASPSPHPQRKKKEAAAARK